MLIGFVSFTKNAVIMSFVSAVPIKSGTSDGLFEIITSELSG